MRQLSEIYPGVPVAIAKAFGLPPLIGDEKIEDYSAFFCLMANERRPNNSMSWFYLKDVVDQSWDIQRERRIKASTIQDRNFDKLKSISKPTALLDARKRKEFGLVAEKPLNEYLPTVYLQDRRAIDGFDRRIASNEMRRAATLREWENWEAKQMAANPGEGRPPVIDGKFTEVAE